MATEDTALVEINSALRASGLGSDTDANFGFIIPDGVIRRVPKKVKVFSAVIPFAWSIINGGNNKLILNDPASDILIEIDSQNYSATSLANELKSLFDANGSLTYTVLVDTVTNIFTISSTSDFGLDFSVSDSLGPILGYGTNVYTSDLSYTATNIVNLVYDGYIHINSSITKGKDNGVIILTGTDVDPEPPLAAVPICGDYGFVIAYQAPPELQPLNIENSKFSNAVRDRNFPVEIDFQLTSPTGAKIDMKGVSWSMVLQFFYN